LTKEQENIDLTEEIDLRQIFNFLSKWKVVIAVITAAAVLTSIIISNFILMPIYESKSMLMVTIASEKQQAPTSREGEDDLEALISTVSRIPTLTMNTYVNQLKSEVLLKRVSEKIALDPNAYSPGAISSITTASIIPDSNLIELKVQHKDPVIAAKINNTIAEEFLALISESNQEKMTKSVGFLDTERQKVEEELDQVTEKLKNFESQPGGVAFLEQQFNTKNEDLSKYQSMLHEVKIELREAEAGAKRLEQELANTPRTIMVPVIGDSQSGYLTEEPNPVYVSLSQEYSARTTKVSEAIAKLNTIESIIGQIRGEVDSIQKDLTERKVEKEKLESEKTRLENARNLLAEKVTQTQIARSIDLGDTAINVVSPAMVPSSPVKPNKMLNMAIAFVLGLIMAIFVAFIIEYLDNTIKNSQDVMNKLNVPLLGVIPHVHAKQIKQADSEVSND
jgi:succinoglycan biosynthesis transport protein ExoP